LSELKDQLKENEVITEATITAVEQIAFTPVTASKTTFGGSGEVHYNSLEQDDSSATKDAVDFHRYAMFTGHPFTDSIRFFSEFELELSVAGEGAVFEIQLDEDYIP